MFHYVPPLYTWNILALRPISVNAQHADAFAPEKDKQKVEILRIPASNVSEGKTVASYACDIKNVIKIVACSHPELLGQHRQASVFPWCCCLAPHHRCRSIP
jgi:hypothetical protein